MRSLSPRLALRAGARRPIVIVRAGGAEAHASASAADPARADDRDRRHASTSRPTPIATLSADQASANAALASKLRGSVILAPLTRVGTLPFRALCADFGAPVTLSEMAFARPLAKGDRVERTRLRRDPAEQLYGFQMTTNNVGEVRG